MSAGVTKTYNPATGAALQVVNNTPPEQVPLLIANAREVQQKLWANLSFKERAKCVYRVKRFLADNADRGATIISQANGKTKQDALATEILPCIMACDWYAKNTQSVLKKQKLPCGNILFANKTNTLEYSPLGVVAIISPWNYPFSIPFGEIIMGLMAGNAIILKVATPTTLVGNFIEECIGAGGFPRGLFSHVVVSGAQISTLLLKGGVDKIFFTGSVKVGKQLMAECAPTLTPVSLELGGKDGMLVLDDADLERATNCALWAGFQNAGQSCGGVERVYVQSAVFDTFVSLLVAKTKALRHGPPGDVPGTVDIGAITTKGQLDTITQQVNDAVAQGAIIAAQSQPVGDLSKGFFYPATVLLNTNHKMTIMKEENFGPVLPVQKFDSLDEGIALMNDCTMALTNSVFSTDGKVATAVASRLQSGVVTINDHLYSHGQSEAPWGGWKDSGLGRTHGYLGLKEMSNCRCVNNDLIPSTWIPRNMWWYPFSAKSYEGIQSGIGFLAPKSIGSFFGSVLKLAPFAIGMMFKRWRPFGTENIDADTIRRQQQRKKGKGWFSAVSSKLALAVPLIGGILLYKKA